MRQAGTYAILYKLVQAHGEWIDSTTILMVANMTQKLRAITLVHHHMTVIGIILMVHVL